MKQETKNKIIKEIIRRVILNTGESHRLVVQDVLDEEFINFCISFFKKIVSKKLSDEPIDVDWYKTEFLSENLDKVDIATNAGLNMKSITNAYNTTTKGTVIQASLDHYESFCNTIERLIETGGDLEIELTIKFNKVSVDLNVSESLIVINALAVKRSAIAGGLWSFSGKNAEKPLVTALCKLYDVHDKHYSGYGPASRREIDFYLISDDGEAHKTEVKLMGRGNPESADVIHARSTEIFVADRLSDLNKEQFDEVGVQWVALNDEGGYKRFKDVLNYYNIPHSDDPIDVEEKLNGILDEMFTPYIYNFEIKENK